jgi:hypothetical protein
MQLTSSLTGHDIDLFMSSLTAALAVLLTVNMIIERKEFLEMLTAMETTRSTLNRDFKKAVAGIRLLSEQVKEAGPRVRRKSACWRPTSMARRSGSIKWSNGFFRTGCAESRAGSGTRRKTRTRNLLIRSQALYPLS